MDQYFEKVKQAADFLKKKIKKFPKILIMTGTGLGDLSKSINQTEKIYYSQIPGFPETTVKGHAGELITGTLKGTPVAVMKGRFHLYEGYSPAQIAFPIRVMQESSVKILIITNAAGGINLSFEKGNIMIIEDHINLTGENPLVGENNDKWGLRFPDMINTYDRDLINLAKKQSERLGIKICSGVYAGLKGPSLETPAEIRFLKTIGAEAVGMSTIQEVITAVHGGIRVLGLSAITNINDPDNPEPATLEGVIETAEKTATVLESLIEKIVENIYE